MKRRKDYIIVAKAIRDAPIRQKDRLTVARYILSALLNEYPLMDKKSFLAQADAENDFRDRFERDTVSTKIDAKFDVPINFEVFAPDEVEACNKLQRFLHNAIVTFGLEKEIVEHELFEFIPEHCTEASKKSSCFGCGNDNCCKG